MRWEMNCWSEVAAGLRSNLRVSDYVGRLGGDEFALLLPETDATAANRVSANFACDSWKR